MYAGPALGIGWGCDGLGPLPERGPKFFFYNRNIWFFGGVYIKVY